MIGPWTVTYHTNAVKVVALEESPTSADRLGSLTVRNGSRRPITMLYLRAANTEARVPFFPAVFEPGETKTLSIGLATTDHNLHIVAALFGDGEAAGDGDPAVVQGMRFWRVGYWLESVNCLSQALSLDHADLNDTSLDAWITSVSRTNVQPLEDVLRLFPGSPVKLKVQGANVGAKADFLVGVRQAADACRFFAQQLFEQPESSRSNALSAWQTAWQEGLVLQQKVVGIDMGVAE